MRTVTRSYESYDIARRVVEELESAGFPAANISLVGRHEDADDGNAGEGAGIGAAVGGAAGLLAGLGLIAIPGIGPVVAAGWLASTAAGAAAGGATGGIIGAFTSAGEDEESANYHAETVRRGGTVVSVKASEDQALSAEAIMDSATPIDRDTRLTEYRDEGWSRFDDKAERYRGPLI
ncbi:MULTISPECIES: hypothetical protein [unclassified Bosea (in: a-proteobacteria)]|uniref:hypothetical protein n=1 Tax=unclassified Bosea (in: a-proteobacteria) TaxID=2653178 RepID=UPI000F751788|nr:MULTISPECIES: hypothetical protein [unclassified Bosea (in: a-proteobacteria)]AZO82165.1 hypothetical protein BLM15_30790 [Bosea sp. Tri-49]RXT20732.1 hypothetical protein B5U98_18270 [Bosea sp. Tri-39]RXT33720.1 hypothetical protein B5U99_18185 [Bosea sp. Tri-54]